MRADRLLSVMMLLQNRGKMRAEELAAELEVSVRTIYRDIDALSIAGIPVYADGGPGGGYALLDSYRTDLTGLSNEEIEALFLLSVPGPLADLHISKQIKGALRKISSSRPSASIDAERHMQNRLYLDPMPWFHKADEVRFLNELQNAIWHDRKVSISYLDKKDNESSREIAPYALVAKASTWYLVADSAKGMRVFRISRISSMTELPVCFRRRENFSLKEFWREWCERFHETLRAYPVQLRVAPEGRDIVSKIWQGTEELIRTATSDAHGWLSISYTFHDEHEASYLILQMGALVQVESPLSLRERLRCEAEAILDLYRS